MLCKDPALRIDMSSLRVRSDLFPIVIFSNVDSGTSVDNRRNALTDDRQGRELVRSRQTSRRAHSRRDQGRDRDIQGHPVSIAIVVV